MSKIYYQNQQNTECSMLIWDTKCPNNVEQNISFYQKKPVETKQGDYIASRNHSSFKDLGLTPFGYRLTKVFEAKEVVGMKNYFHCKATAVRELIPAEVVFQNDPENN